MNKEGQTQVPVGGMKWEDVQILARKHAEQIIEMGWRDSPDKDDIIADFISGYASAPPPSPVGIDEIKNLSNDIHLKKYHDISTNEFDDGFVEGFKAGYSASLPSSSVTGEESWKEVIINRISEFQKIYHANEAGRLTLALKAIEELIPPSYFKSLPVTGESEAIEKAIIEELESLLSSGVHPEYLPEKINDRIAELKGDKSYT